LSNGNGDVNGNGNRDGNLRWYRL